MVFFYCLWKYGTFFIDRYSNIFFNITYRGKIEAKNKGMIDMYFVESII